MDVTKACRDVSELTEQAQKACKLFIDKCKAKGLNVLITETYRSQERQNYLYEQGRTRSGKVVTWTKQSRHTSRRAWDICKNVKGHEYDDANFFKECGNIAKELGITWGGSWTSTPDTPHFEVSADWQTPKEDVDLKSAAHKIAMRYKINEASWDSIDHIKLQYVPGLLNKLGGIDKLVAKGIISDKQMWLTGQYNANHVRSLLIKFAATL